MNFLNHASVILRNQLEIIEISVWNWREPNIEAQMKEAEPGSGTFVPPGQPLPGILYYKINGLDKLDFFSELKNWQYNYLKEVDSNIALSTNKTHLIDYLKIHLKSFNTISNNIKQEQKEFGKRIYPYFKYKNAEIKIEIENIADDEGEKRENRTYKKIEVKENPTYEEIHIMLSCSDILHELKKINIDIIRKLELRLNKIEKKKGIEKVKIEPKLYWDKSAIDMMELIVALINSDSIISINKSKPLTRKYVVKVFEEFFGYKIGDPEGSLSHAINRKRGETPYLSFLMETFEKHVENKIERRKSPR